MTRLWGAALAASLAIPAIASDMKTLRIQRVIQEMPPPVLVRGQSPELTSLDARMAALRVPGVSIAVIHRGRIEWARGFGTTWIGGPPVNDGTLTAAMSTTLTSRRAGCEFSSGSATRGASKPQSSPRDKVGWTTT